MSPDFWRERFRPVRHRSRPSEDIRGKPSARRGWRSDGDSGTLSSPAPRGAAGRPGAHGFWGQCMSDWAPGPALAAYHAGVMVIGELAAQFTDEAWESPTPCLEWRAADLAGHLRCVADDYHEYLDDAPVSRLARLMARSASPQSLARKLARQNAAELAALPDAAGPEHIAAFAASARAYAPRALAVWDLPHHRYCDTVVTVGGMVGTA